MSLSRRAASLRAVACSLCYPTDCRGQPLVTQEAVLASRGLPSKDPSTVAFTGVDRPRVEMGGRAEGFIGLNASEIDEASYSTVLPPW